MPVTIHSANMKYRNGDGEYVGINGVAERTIAEMIAEVAESIPSDYTTISKSLSARFGLSHLAHITYNYTTKSITFPDGFIYRDGKGTAKTTQTIDVSSVLSAESCVLFVRSNGTIYAKVWTASADAASDCFLGYIFRQYVWVNGVDFDRIWVVNSDGDRLAPPESQRGAYICLTGTQTVVYDETNKVITIPQAFYVCKGVPHGSPSGGWSIDWSSIATAAVLFMKRDGSIYPVSWNGGTPESYDDEVVGYVYGNLLVLNGIPQHLIKTITSNGRQSNGTWFSPPFFGLSGLAGVVTYNFTTKVLSLPGGFISYRGKSYARTASTLNLTNYLTSDACFIFVGKDGTIYAKNWVGCQADSQEDQMLGYVFYKSVVLLGVPPSLVTVIDESSSDQVYCFGDSITAGVGSTKLFHMLWHDWDKDLALYNWGIGSTGYLREASGSVVVGGGTIGRGTTQTASGNNTVLDVMQGVTSAMPNIVIFAGTNDYSGNYTLAAFRTAVGDTLDYALTKTRNVLVITPIKREGWNTDENSLNLKLKDYSDVIKEECASRGIVCVDGFDVSIDPSIAGNKTAFAPDGLHPNEAGHAKMARNYYAKFLEAIGH